MKDKTKKYILLIIFISVIYLPTIISFFVGTDDLNIENRELSNEPKLTFKTINTYPVEFEKYYNDNLPFRKELISSYRSLNYKIFNESGDARVIIGNNEDGEKWFFFNSPGEGDPISYIDGRKNFTSEEINTSIKTMKEQTNLLKKNKINLYYLMIPNKSSIYSQFLPKTINVADDAFNKVYNDIKKSNINNIYYPYEFFKEASKNNEVYYRTDSHWNKYGTYLFMKDVFENIYPNKNILSNNKIDFSYTMSAKNDLYNFMGINVPVKDNNIVVQYDYSTVHRTIEECTNGKCDSKNVELNELVHNSVEHDNKVEIYTNDNYVIDETVMLIGDSYSINVVDPLVTIYKKVVRILLNTTNYDERMLNRYKPSKIFLVRVERCAYDGINFRFYDKNK